MKIQGELMLPICQLVFSPGTAWTEVHKVDFKINMLAINKQ